MTDADPLLVQCPRCGRAVLPLTSDRGGMALRTWICAPCKDGDDARGSANGRGGQGAIKTQVQMGGVWIDLP